MAQSSASIRYHAPGDIETDTARRSFGCGTRSSRRLVLLTLCTILAFGTLFATRDHVRNIDLEEALSSVASSLGTEQPTGLDSVDKNDGANDNPTASQIPLDKGSCESRRGEIKDLLHGRNAHNSLKWDQSHELLDQPFTLARSQSLFSDTCWTAGSRYGLYNSQVDRVVNMCNRLSQKTSRTAFVIRLEEDHQFTEDANDHMRAIILEVAWCLQIDFVLLHNIRSHDEIDIERVPEDLREFLVQYTNDEVFDGYPEETKATSMVNRPNLSYGNEKFSRYSTTYYQFVQAWFFDKKEEYKFAYFIDSHVRSLGSFTELFEALLAQTDNMAGIDLLSLDPIVTTRSTVYWGPKTSQRPESFFKGSFTFHGISRALAVAMKDTLMSGINAAHDAFLPAVAIRNGSEVVMFAHPIAKRKENRLLFETYERPETQEFRVLNLVAEADSEAAVPVVVRQKWQFGGTFAADTIKWVDDLPQTRWIDAIYQEWRASPKLCHPGLLLYPVSGR